MQYDTPARSLRLRTVACALFNILVASACGCQTPQQLPQPGSVSAKPPESTHPQASQRITLNIIGQYHSVRRGQNLCIILSTADQPEYRAAFAAHSWTPNEKRLIQAIQRHRGEPTAELESWGQGPATGLDCPVFATRGVLRVETSHDALESRNFEDWKIVEDELPGEGSEAVAP